MATVYEIFRQCWTEKRGITYRHAYFDFEMLYWYWLYGIYVGN